MNPIRVAALAVLAAGALLLVLDVMQNLMSSNWEGMSLSRIWGLMAPGSMMAVENFIEGSVSVLLWQKILLPLLLLPAWVVLVVAGLILLVVGKRYD